MKDLLVALSFITMLLSPCLVAMSTHLHEGADAYDKDPEQFEEAAIGNIPA
jgi:hypothetical protein